MPKQKTELLLIIILIPILIYVGWQFYNSYFKSPSKEIEELEKAATEEPTPPEPEKPEAVEIKQPEKPSPPKGTLDYTGFTERDPLKPPLPVKEKIEKPPEPPKPIKKPKEKPGEEIKKEPSKEIILPTFIVTGIVWSKESPRAIMDHQVYKIGDIVKGAKILEITQKGILMIYEGKEFWVIIQRGG